MSTKHLPFSTLLKLRPTPPYDLSLTVHKPAGWSFLTPFETFEDDTLWTGVRLNSGRILGLKLRSEGTVEDPEILCTVHSSKKVGGVERKEISEMAEWMLNTKEDISEFYSLAEHDAILASSVEDLFGMRNTTSLDVFHRLVLAVTLQMAPIKRSYQMMNLLIEKYGQKIEFDGKTVLYWPSPQRIAKTDVRELKQNCKLGYRAKPLKGIAESMCKGYPTIQMLGKMPAQEAKAKLMELKGIGEYSAEIVSPHPGFPLDVWSAKIFCILLLGEETKSPRSVIPNLKKIAEERWGRWRRHAFTYVLNDLDNLSRRFKVNLTKL